MENITGCLGEGVSLCVTSTYIPVEKSQNIISNL